MKYNVLLLGSGGREHALAWKIAQSPVLGEFYALPGNPIDMVVCGPEDPLVEGLKDFLESCPDVKEDLLFVGPGKDGARLEGSKDFAKEFMARHGIPTAAYRSFTAEQRDEASAFLRSLRPPYVVKADGLAAGKGVIISQSLEEAEESLEHIFGGQFGAAGAKVVIEEYLDGVEVSFFVLTDGHGYLLLPEAKDYKRIWDGDKGLNTGGMGSVSPVPFCDGEFVEKVRSRIIEPTVKGLESENMDEYGLQRVHLFRPDELRGRSLCDRVQCAYGGSGDGVGDAAYRQRSAGAHGRCGRRGSLGADNQGVTSGCGDCYRRVGRLSGKVR